MELVKGVASFFLANQSLVLLAGAVTAACGLYMAFIGYFTNTPGSPGEPNCDGREVNEFERLERESGHLAEGRYENRPNCGRIREINGVSDALLHKEEEKHRKEEERKKDEERRKKEEEKRRVEKRARERLAEETRRREEAKAKEQHKTRIFLNFNQNFANKSALL